MNRVWVAIAAVVALIIGLRPAVAAAGPVEEFVQLVLHPSNPDIMIARYENGGNGLFYTDDGGQNWKLGCASMFAPGESSLGAMTITGDGSVLVGVFGGLWQAQAGGCGWSKAAALEDHRVSDVTYDPSDPSVALAVTGSGNPGTVNGIYRREASSGAWSALGKQDEALITRLRVAKTAGGLRLYETMQQGMHPVGDAGTMVPNYFVRVSDDMGASFRQFPVDVPNGSLRLEAVDPSQPDRIVLSVNRSSGNDSIYISSDQGETLTEYLQVTQLGGVALAPDGRIWIGEFGDASNNSTPRGLWAAPNLDTAPTRLTGDYQVECLSYQPATDTLYACQRWALGKVDQSNGAFTQVLTFDGAREFVRCEDVDAAAVCKSQLCSAYCGAGHFCTAPVCSAYDEPFCGPTADGVGGSSGTTAPGSGGQGGKNVIASGGVGAAPPFKNDGDNDAAPKSNQGGGGCATSGAAPITGGAAGQLAFIALCCAAWSRRYRRRDDGQPTLQLPSLELR